MIYLLLAAFDFSGLCIECEGSMPQHTKGLCYVAFYCGVQRVNPLLLVMIYLLLAAFDFSGFLLRYRV